MRTVPLSRTLTVFAVGLLLTACADAPVAPAAATAPTLSRAAQSPSATVNWHPQQAGMGHTGAVDGASAMLVRTPNGISYHISTTSLTPGNAYTLWLVVVNNPAACAATPCTAPEIFSPATRSQVRYAAGHVAGGSGRGTFAGAIREGELSGWVADRMLEDASSAEVHLVINDHGPMIPAYMPSMIHSYRGGCSNASPFPGVFPATALADGEVGPNICRLFQSAVFPAP